MTSHPMKPTLLALIAALILAVLPLRAADGPVTAVDARDAAMNQAIASARKQLPHFWSRMASPAKGESDFNLKVRVEDKNGVEHFWCADVERKNGSLSAVINNEPVTVKSVKIGQRINFAEVQISDWMYMRDGKMIGNYTLRPLMKTMSSEDRRQLESMLGPLPTS